MEFVSYGALRRMVQRGTGRRTFPTAASPSNTSLTDEDGLGALAADESAIVVCEGGDAGRLALRLLPTA